MEGVQEQSVRDLYSGAEIMQEETGRVFTFKISYYEIYSGKIFDLLNDHKKLQILEDKSQ